MIVYVGQHRAVARGFVAAAVLIIGSLAFPKLAQAGLIGLSSSHPAAGVYSIDASTGAATLLTTTNGSSLVGATFLDGVLYGADVCGANPCNFLSVVSIDTTTGAATFISDQGGSNNWHSLAGNESAGVLYSVDLNEVTFPLMSLTPGGILTTIGPTGIGVTALAYDNVGGVLYGMSGTGLYTINTSTGAATLVGFGGVGGAVGLAFHETNGILYLNQSAPTFSLYTVNVATGATTLVGPNGVTGIDGLAWIADNGVVPEPSAVALFGLGLIAVARRRFRAAFAADRR